MSGVAVERSIVATTDQSQSGVAGRYARALFDLATEHKAVADVASALSSFQGLIDESEDLQRLMRSPVFKSEDQSAAIEAIAATVPRFRKRTFLAAGWVISNEQAPPHPAAIEPVSGTNVNWTFAA